MNFNLDQKSQRVEWTNPGTKTVTKDQFSVDLWKEVQPGQTLTYRFTCHMVICPIASFETNQDERNICRLHNKCKFRYDNLFRNANTKQNDINGATHSEIIEAHGDLTINVVQVRVTQ